jgi:integrase/recombinase XerC
MESRKALGVSPKSLIYYRSCLSKSLERLGNPYSAKPEDIIAFLNTIPPNDRGLSTRHCYRRVLNTFYTWLNKTYNVPNPMSKVPAPKLDKVIMPTLRLEDIKTIMANEPTKSKAIIALATASGLRRTELANVKLEDIDWQNGRIKTKGKGRKEAYAIIGMAEPYLKAWIAESGKKSGSLFGLTSLGLQTYFRRLEERTGLKTNAHVFRRSFATILKTLGVDIEQIRILGRWEDIEMVQRYTRDFSFDDASKLLKQKVDNVSGLLNS